MARAAHEVWFLVVPRTSLGNVSGPWEVLGHANDLLEREAYRMTAYGPGAPTTVARYGLHLAGVRPLPARVPRPPDTAIVAGFSPAAAIPADHAPLVPWLRRHAPRIPRVVSVCTGAFALAAAGLLDGRRATTHWMHLDDLRARYPAVRVVDQGIHVGDRGMWTSAGLTAGVDLTLALVERDHGHDLAMRVAKRMVLFLRRSGHQAQFSPALRLQEREPPRLRDLTAFAVEHLAEDLPVERLAGHLGLSPRSLARWCRAELGESPAAMVRRLRLAEARRLLESTTLPLTAVAVRTGLGDQSTLWRACVRELGVTPAEYRGRFAKRA